MDGESFDIEGLVFPITVSVIAFNIMKLYRMLCHECPNKNQELIKVLNIRSVNPSKVRRYEL